MSTEQRAREAAVDFWLEDRTEYNFDRDEWEAAPDYNEHQEEFARIQDHFQRAIEAAVAEERAKDREVMQEAQAVLRGPVYGGFGEHPNEKLCAILEGHGQHRNAAMWESRRRSALERLRVRLETDAPKAGWEEYPDPVTGVPLYRRKGEADAHA